MQAPAMLTTHVGPLLYAHKKTCHHLFGSDGCVRSTLSVVFKLSSAQSTTCALLRLRRKSAPPHFLHAGCGSDGEGFGIPQLVKPSAFELDAKMVVSISLTHPLNSIISSTGSKDSENQIRLLRIVSRLSQARIQIFSRSHEESVGNEKHFPRQKFRRLELFLFL